MPHTAADIRTPYRPISTSMYIFLRLPESHQIAPRPPRMFRKLRPHTQRFTRRGVLGYEKSRGELNPMQGGNYAALDSSHLPSLYSRRNLATFFFDSSALVAFSG